MAMEIFIGYFIDYSLDLNFHSVTWCSSTQRLAIFNEYRKTKGQKISPAVNKSTVYLVYFKHLICR